jgi:hypothetical protein
MQLRDLLMDDLFCGIMDDFREELAFIEEGEAKLNSILDTDVSCLDGDILIHIKRFRHAVDEYQEDDAKDGIESWLYWKGGL